MTPAHLEQLFRNGRVIDVVLAVLAFEAVAIVLFSRGQRGLGRLDLLGNLAAGALLLLAWRSAAAGEPWFLTAALMAGSLPAHVFDLWRRFRNHWQGDQRWTIESKQTR